MGYNFKEVGNAGGSHGFDYCSDEYQGMNS